MIGSRRLMGRVVGWECDLVWCAFSRKLVEFVDVLEMRGHEGPITWKKFVQGGLRTIYNTHTLWLGHSSLKDT